MLNTAERECRRGPHRHRYLQAEALEIQQAGNPGDQATHQQCGQHCVTWLQALGQQVAEEHAEHKQRLDTNGAEDFAADVEQHACQQRGGQGRRYPPHEAVEAASDAAQRDQGRCEDEGADRFGIGTPGRLVISSAAPGVDQATTTGVR